VRVDAATAVVATALVLCAGVFGLAPPRLTLVNQGVLVAYPWTAPAGAAVAALSLLLMAGATRGGLRRMAGLACAAALAAAAHLAVYRVSADATTLSARGLTGSRQVSWREMKDVQSQAGRIEVHALDGRALRLNTSRLPPRDAATLERTISRRLREGG
jgi:hypothetical protein